MIFSKQLVLLKKLRQPLRNFPERSFFCSQGGFPRSSAQTWDAQIEDDVSAGRLDDFARAALEEHRAGKTAPFPGDAE